MEGLGKNECIVREYLWEKSVCVCVCVYVKCIPAETLSKEMTSSSM